MSAQSRPRVGRWVVGLFLLIGIPISVHNLRLLDESEQHAPTEATARRIAEEREKHPPPIPAPPASAKTPDPKQLLAVRRKMAARIEQSFLAHGLDAYVTASEKNGQTLSIQWIGCNRATLYQLMNGTNEDSWTQQIEAAGLQQALRQAGFNRVNCDDTMEGVAWTRL